jgi:EAL domain-containing protein (putative c-di-GMP-specific phosphodiesterase class I)
MGVTMYETRVDDETNALQRSVRGTVNPLASIARVVEQALVMIEHAGGAAIELIVDGQLISVYSLGLLERGRNGHDTNTARAGLGAAAIVSGVSQRCDDAHADSRVDRRYCERMGIRSLLAVPLISNGRVKGVLKVCSPMVAGFDDGDVEILDRLAEFVGSVVTSASDVANATERLFKGLGVSQPLACPVSRFVANVVAPGMVAQRADTQRINDIIENHRFDIVLQPIVNLSSGRAVGYEALCRFHGSIQPPDVLLADAYRVGLSSELEVALAGAALELLPSLPRDTYLSVNVGAELLASPQMCQLMQGPMNQVVFEMTEQRAMTDYPATIAAVARLRDAGGRLAVDDTGAGFSSLSHILRLQPDIVKLDRELTAGIDTDPVRQALAAALVNFSSTSGATIVAEGIEHAQQLQVVRNLGIPHGQGFHIGRPAPSATYFGS